MNEKSIVKTLGSLDTDMRRMIDNCVPMAEFRLSKRLAANYADESVQPHVQSTWKRKARNLVRNTRLENVSTT